MNEQQQDITLLLQQLKAGDRSSEQQLIELVYHDLKSIAARQRRKIKNQTINTTGLVHEAWIKLSQKGLDFNDRQHFMAVATLAIRHLLINAARKKKGIKHQHESAITYASQVHGQFDDGNFLLSLDQALDQLEKYNSRLAQVFQMRFFAGFTEQEIADCLDISVRTVHRDWLKAKLMMSVNFTES